MIFSSPLLSRVAALGLLLVLAFALYAGLIAPLLERYAASAEHARIGEAMRARYTELSQQGGALRAKLAELHRARAASAYFIEASSEATASAALQERMKAVVAESGAVVTSLNSLPAEARADHRRVPLRVLLSADTSALQKLLYGLESSQPGLIVEKLFIRGRTARADAGRHLDVELEVVGFLRGTGE